GPRQLDLVASIDLRRLATVVVLLPLVLPDGVRQQPEHHDEDRRRDDQDEDRQLEDRSCRRGGRREDLCRAQGSRPGECAADQGIQRLSSSREAHLAKACRPRSCAENMPRFGPPALGARTRWHRGDPSRLRQALHGIRTACPSRDGDGVRSEEHTSELQSRGHLVCRLLLEKKKQLHPSNNKCSYANAFTELSFSP